MPRLRFKKTQLPREREANTNSTVDDRLRRLDLGCSYCPPNRFENQHGKPVHSRTKPRYKTRRRGR